MRALVWLEQTSAATRSLQRRLDMSRQFYLSVIRYTQKTTLTYWSYLWSDLVVRSAFSGPCISLWEDTVVSWEMPHRHICHRRRTFLSIRSSSDRLVGCASTGYNGEKKTHSLYQINVLLVMVRRVNTIHARTPYFPTIQCNPNAIVLQFHLSKNRFIRMHFFCRSGWRRDIF